LMSSSRRLICARSCAGNSSLPSATRSSDARLPVRRSRNDRTLDSEEEDAALAIRLQEGDFAT
jgi:hypothetical protein